MPGRFDAVRVVGGLVERVGAGGGRRRNPGPRIPQGEHLQVLTGKRTDRLKQVGSQVTVRRGSWEWLPSMNPQNEC